MKKTILISFLFSFLIACDETESVNATPTIEAIGQYCLDNKNEVDNCAVSGDAGSCIAFQESDVYLHYAWSAYKECVISSCVREAQGNPDLNVIGLDAAVSICVDEELTEGMGLEARCGNSLILCNSMASAGEYWGE